MEGSEGIAPEQPTEAPVAEVPSAPDLSGFEARMTELAENQATILERFDSAPQYQEPEYEEPEFDPDQATPEERAEHLVAGILQRQLEQMGLDPQAITEQLQGVEQRISHGERMNAIADMEQQYPNLRGEQAEQVLQAAEQYAEQGVFSDPLDPRAIELAYLAGIGREAAASETPAGAGQVTTLEGAGAEAPGQPAPDIGAGIVGAGQTPSWVNG